MLPGRFDSKRVTRRVLRGDQTSDSVQRYRGSVQPGRARPRPTIGLAAIRRRYARCPRPVGHAVRVDGPVQPVGCGTAYPVAVSVRRGVPVRPGGRSVRDQQRGQKVRGRQRTAVRGTQVLQAAAGTSDQPAVRPGRQPSPVQQHVVQLDVLTDRSSNPTDPSYIMVYGTVNRMHYIILKIRLKQTPVYYNIFIKIRNRH